MRRARACALASWPRLVPSGHITSNKGHRGCGGLRREAAALAARSGAGGSRGRSAASSFCAAGGLVVQSCLSCSLPPAHRPHDAGQFSRRLTARPPALARRAGLAIVRGCNCLSPGRTAGEPHSQDGLWFMSKSLASPRLKKPPRCTGTAPKMSPRRAGSRCARPPVATCSVQNESRDHPLGLAPGPAPSTRQACVHEGKARALLLTSPSDPQAGPRRALIPERFAAPNNTESSHCVPLSPCDPFLLSDGTTVLAFISSIVLPSENIFPPCARTCERHADPRGPGRPPHRSAPLRTAPHRTAPLRTAPHSPRRLFLPSAAAPAAPRTLRGDTDGLTSDRDQFKI